MPSRDMVSQLQDAFDLTMLAMCGLMIVVATNRLISYMWTTIQKASGRSALHTKMSRTCSHKIVVHAYGWICRSCEIHFSVRTSLHWHSRGASLWLRHIGSHSGTLSHIVTGKPQRQSWLVPLQVLLMIPSLASLVLCSEVLFHAVGLGIFLAHVLLLALWCLAQRQEKHHRQWKVNINRSIKAAGLRPYFATHTVRKLTWSPPTVFHRSFWVVAAFTLVTLFFIPTMPTQPPPSPFLSALNPTRLNLPPTTLYDTPALV